MGRITENELSQSLIEKINNKSSSISTHKEAVDKTFWGTSTDGLYYYYISHKLNLNEEDIIDLKLIDSESNEDVFVSYRILDKNSLYIYSIDKYDGELIIKY